MESNDDYQGFKDYVECGEIDGEEEDLFRDSDGEIKGGDIDCEKDYVNEY